MKRHLNENDPRNEDDTMRMIWWSLSHSLRYSQVEGDIIHDKVCSMRCQAFAVCTLCEEKAGDNSEHALLTCSYIRVGGENLLLALQQEDLTMTWERIKFADFRSLLHDFSYSVHSGAAVDIKSRKENMCMAFCTCPSGITSSAPEKRKVGPVRG